MIELVMLRKQLAKKSKELKLILFSENNKNSNKTKQLQDEYYKKYKFCDELLKASRKINGGNYGN